MLLADRIGNWLCVYLIGVGSPFHFNAMPPAYLRLEHIETEFAFDSSNLIMETTVEKDGGFRISRETIRTWFQKSCDTEYTLSSTLLELIIERQILT